MATKNQFEKWVYENYFIIKDLNSEQIMFRWKEYCIKNKIENKIQLHIS